MVGSVERKMKARIYQRRRRNTLKGSVKLKTYHETQNKKMQNLFTRKGINPNTSFSQPLKKLEQRQLADFIRKVDLKLKEMSPKNDYEAELDKLYETKLTFLQEVGQYLKLALTTSDMETSEYNDILAKMDEISKKLISVNNRIEEINKKIDEKNNKAAKDINILVKSQMISHNIGTRI